MATTADTRTDGVEPVPSPRRRDRGATLVEMLVAIVLLGTVVIATLSALRMTVVGTRIERDHAKAHQWLQSAIHLLEKQDFLDCENNIGVFQSAEDARLGYQGVIRTNATAPYGWTNGQISVNAIDVWDPMAEAWVQYETTDFCLDDVGRRVQRLTLEVVGPSNDIIETVELVKSDV